jgi:hypothetical protein
MTGDRPRADLDRTADFGPSAVIAKLSGNYDREVVGCPDHLIGHVAACSSLQSHTFWKVNLPLLKTFLFEYQFSRAG